MTTDPPAAAADTPGDYVLVRRSDLDNLRAACDDDRIYDVYGPARTLVDNARTDGALPPEVRVARAHRDMLAEAARPDPGRITGGFKP